MKDKKHIDELFKDRFKNFEASPSPQVWENIHAELQKKKKDRKVIPLWWKLGGVAALLALLLTVGNSVFNLNDTDNNTITTEDTTRSVEDNSTLDTLKENQIHKNDAVVSEDKEDNTINKITEEASEVNANKTINNSDAVYNKANALKDAVAEQNNSVKTSERTTNTSNKLIKKETPVIVETERVAISTEKLSDNVPTKASAMVQEKKTQANNPLIKEGLDVTKSETVTIASEDSNKKNQEISEEKTAEENKTSILDAITEQEVLKTEDAVTKRDVPDERWDVAPNFAPVYYNTLSSGSSIDPSFADNSQSGDVNISYGVQVSYAVSNRLSIRTGVSNVDLSYSTGDVELGTGPVASALASIDYGGKSVVLTAVDQGVIAADQLVNGGFGNLTPKSTNGAAEINQSITYYEVPLELKYSLINNKVGVNLIGGLSTLFLGNNEVSVKAGDFRDVLGEANNLSSVSFSTNIGLGFDYKLGKRLKFNVEPMFKYQLNPYTDSSVDFQPYYIGVYTGLSFRF